MRGTRVVGDDYGLAVGIIPAYAGNTTRPPWETGAFRDHPRVCGEHLRDMRGDLGGRGSSPRMRGTLMSILSSISWLGIIPAYAGNTSVLSEAMSRPRDHPRVCGEHSNAAFGSAAVPGSSPRMRGTLLWYGVVYRHDGIIPAYAGNTPSLIRSRILRWDHPRVCGEHSLSPRTSRIGAGSSPRMRGTRRRCLCLRICRGIIPAYAGNTCAGTCRRARRWDHPRVCGEHPRG